MNKKIIMLVALSIGSVAFADIAVNLKAAGCTVLNEGETFPVNGPGQVLSPGMLVQLIWKADNVGYQSDNLPLTLLNPGEMLLFSGFSDGAGTFSLGTGLNGSYTDLNVGNVDVNAGYFYARLFDQTAPAAGANFIEFALEGPALTEYDAQTVSTIYFGSGVDSMLTGDHIITEQSTTVIPEPATFGLMGIAGLGLFLARKKARR